MTIYAGSGVSFISAALPSGVATEISEAFQVKYNGVVAGSGPIEVMELNVFDLPELRTGARVRAGDHGMYPGVDLLQGRMLELTLEAWGDTPAQLAPVVEDLLKFTTPQLNEQPLTFRIDGWEDDLYVLAKPRRRSGVTYSESSVSGSVIAKIGVQFFATDPRLYSLTESVAGLSIASVSEGLEFNATAPFVFGVGESTTVQVDNLCNFASPPTATLVGPLTNPVLENVTTGQSLSLTGELADGETLEIDFLNHTVLLDGTASRYYWVNDPSGWWVLEPGTSEVRLGGSGAGSASLRYRSAWV